MQGQLTNTDGVQAHLWVKGRACPVVAGRGYSCQALSAGRLSPHSVSMESAAGSHAWRLEARNQFERVHAGC